MVDVAHQDSVLANGAALLPDFEEDEDPDELLSDEDAPDLQDEIAKTLTSLKVRLTPQIYRHVLCSCAAAGRSSRAFKVGHRFSLIPRLPIVEIGIATLDL